MRRPAWSLGHRGGAPPMLLMAVALGVMVLAGLGMGRLTQLRQLIQQSEDALQRATQENQELARKVVDVRNERAGLDEQVRRLSAQCSQTTSELESARQNLQSVQQQETELSQQRASLEAQVAQRRREWEQTQQQLAHLEQDKTELTRSMARLTARAKLLDRDTRQLAQKVAAAGGADPAPTPAWPAAPALSTAGAPTTVELPPIVVRKTQPGMPNAIRAQILEVDVPHQFVIINKGGDDGVMVGMAFDVVRGAESVGRATATRVRSTIAACDVLLAKTPGPLRVGDVVVQRGP